MLYVSFFKQKKKKCVHHDCFLTGMLLGRSKSQFLVRLMEDLLLSLMKVGLSPISVKILLLYNVGIIEAFIADLMMNSNDSWPVYVYI